MATLVLTAVGTVVGGPIGGMLGAVAGQAIDARWLTPGGRKGPRLSDLRVQTSSYGSGIPRLFGTMRVAGTVIWATDLVERRQRRSAGKGQPRTTTYSYSASFAVALSSRPVLGVRRIWADGNILRGSDGAFVEQTGFRLHAGDADQPVDPFIAAAEGPGAAPAYRGLAYAVFEELDLTAFGNRIPSLTFEVEADAGPLNLGQPVADALGVLAAQAMPEIGGYALGGGSRREAIEPLTALVPVRRTATGWAVVDGAATALPDAASVSGPASPERRIGAADRAPRAVTVAHYDPARDYQTGIQTAMVPGGEGASRSIDLPVSAAAAQARLLAERAAARVRGTRSGMSWPGGLAALAVPPGALVDAGGARMQVTARRIEGGVAMLELSGVPDAVSPVLAADGGRAVTSPDQPTGDTAAALFDLPALVPADVDQTRLVLAAAGSGAGWRRAGVALVPAAGAAEQPMGHVTAAAVIGTVTAVGGAGTAMLFDDASWIEVTLARADMQLSNAADADLLAGANAALAGDELLQFGHAAPLGNRRWRLTRLLRGRRGTPVSAAAGAPFALADDEALLPLGDALTVPQAGGAVLVAATGAAAALQLPILTAGRAQQPLPPVHLRGDWEGDGGLTLRWVRRSRTGFDWRDRVDAPMDADNEAYQVALLAGASQTVMMAGVPQVTLSAATLSAWRSGGAASLSVAVSQVGRLALSQPLAGSFAL